MFLPLGIKTCFAGKSNLDVFRYPRCVSQLETTISSGILQQAMFDSRIYQDLVDEAR